MSGKKKFVASVVVAGLLSFPAFAAADTALTASDRAAIVQTLAVKLSAAYIEPAVAKRVGSAIARKNAEGGYASATSVQAFSAALAQDLRALSGDLHFSARLVDGFRESSDDDVPTRAEMDQARDAVERSGYGIEKVERLPGNVGYIELRHFDMTEFAGPAYTAAMSLMAGTDALILDLRRNGGGSPASVAYLMSHFFPLGDWRHLNDVYERTALQRVLAMVEKGETEKPIYTLRGDR